jgi:ATPases with chaperone activity, ATP-binding subunit
MILNTSDAAKDCIAEKGYDIRYGARPLKRVLASDVLNPLSRLVLDGGIRDGDIVKVRTLGEAQKMKKDSPEMNWISSSKSEDKNSIVVLRNHTTEIQEDESWDDDEFLMEDGLHSHR